MINLAKNKKKLLMLFFEHAGQEFYMQEIGRLLRKKPGVFQRTLNNLEKEGVLKSQFKANARYFRINPDYPIYNELKSILLKSHGKLAAVILITAIFVSAVFAQENNIDVNNLELKGAVMIAYKSNKDIQAQEQQVLVAAANVMGAKSNFFPKLNLNGGYTRNGAVLSKGTPGAKKDVGIWSGYQNDNLLDMTVEQTIYNGGQDIANFRQSKVNYKIASVTLRAQMLDTEMETRRLYYGLLLAQETLRIARELLGQARAHYEDMKSKLGQGTATSFDVLTARVKVSQIAPEVVKAENAVELISAELKKLLGFKLQDPLGLAGKLAYETTAIEEGSFLKAAYLNRPEMILKNLGVDLNKWGIDYAKASYRPQVSANLDYMYRSNNLANMYNRQHNNWSAGVAVTVPIFDGWSSRALVDAAKDKYARSIIDKDNVYDQIAVDVRKACLDLKEGEAVIAAQKDYIEQATEALRLAKANFDFGEGTGLDVLDAMVSLSQAQKGLYEDIYNYLMSQAYLDRVRGQSMIGPVSLTGGEAKNEKKA